MTDVAVSRPDAGSTPPAGEKVTKAPEVLPMKHQAIEIVQRSSNTRPNSPDVEGDNREIMVNDDIILFEAWFEVMTKNEKDKVNVEELVDKLSTSGLFTFNNNLTNLARKTEEKAVKEDLLDLIEADLSLNVLGWISINQFFKVIVRFPRYLYRLKRAAGDVSNPPLVWENPEPMIHSQDEDDIETDELNDVDPFAAPDASKTAEDAQDAKQLKRLTWRSRFADLFSKSSIGIRKKRKSNPRRFSRQTSSFYEKCRSVRHALMGKKSSVKVFLKEDDEEFLE